MPIYWDYLNVTKICPIIWGSPPAFLGRARLMPLKNKENISSLKDLCIFSSIFEFLNKTIHRCNIAYSRAIYVLMISIFITLKPAKLYGQEISNSEIKASWIYTVFDWLDWKDRPKNTKSIICAIGRDKVYMYLRRTEADSGKKKNSRQFLVQNKAIGDDFKECNLLYISESEQEYYMNILETVNNSKGIITISSIGGFASHGGAIEFVIKKKARLIMNMRVIKNARVSVDDELYGWVETIN